jgi:hypothetical protein
MGQELLAFIGKDRCPSIEERRRGGTSTVPYRKKRKECSDGIFVGFSCPTS